MSKVVLYALKCDSGYLKTDGQSFHTVDMPKASVFESLDVLQAFMSKIAALENVHVVELTIQEREIT